MLRREELSQILVFIRRYGMDQVGVPDPRTASRAEVRPFLVACHDGYQRARDMLMPRLIANQEAAAVVRERIKQSRSAKDGKAQAYSLSLEALEFEEAILRKLADTLAWLILDSQHWMARRLFNGQPPPRISESNIESVMEVARQLEHDPLVFALPTDLTSFVRIGDLLVIGLHHDSGRRRALLEVKEGKVNEAILDFLNSPVAECPRAAYFFAQEIGPKGVEQVGRIVHQVERGTKFIEIVSEERGIDPFSNQPIEIGPDVIPLEDYDLELDSLLDRASNIGIATQVIDDCLVLTAIHQGMMAVPAGIPERVQGEWSDGILQAALAVARDRLPRQLEDGLNHIVAFDLANGLFEPLSIPIFLRNISEEYILDILFGSLVVIIQLDLDGLLRLAGSMGMEGGWIRGKQARRWTSSRRKGEVVEIGGEVPVFRRNGQEIVMGGGLICRMVWDGTTPRSVLRLIGASLSLAEERRGEENATS